MSSFNEFLTLAKTQTEDLAKSLLQDCAQAAIADGYQFLEDCKADLEWWTSQLQSGQLSLDEFESLVRGKKDVAEMKALQRAGLTLVRIDKFKISLLDTLVKTATKFFV